MNLKGYNILSLGLIDASVYEYNSGGIGWEKGSIAIHSDDGKLFNENGIGKRCVKPFDYGEHVIGCAYDIKAKEVFWTKNGKKFTKPIQINFADISAAFAISQFTSIEINYGNKPFMFDLEEEYKTKGYL